MVFLSTHVGCLAVSSAIEADEISGLCEMTVPDAEFGRQAHGRARPARRTGWLIMYRLCCAPRLKRMGQARG